MKGSKVDKLCRALKSQGVKGWAIRKAMTQVEKGVVVPSIPRAVRVKLRIRIAKSRMHRAVVTYNPATNSWRVFSYGGHEQLKANGRKLQRKRRAISATDEKALAREKKLREESRRFPPLSDRARVSGLKTVIKDCN